MIFIIPAIILFIIIYGILFIIMERLGATLDSAVVGNLKWVQLLVIIFFALLFCCICAWCCCIGRCICGCCCGDKEKNDQQQTRVIEVVHVNR